MVILDSTAVVGLIRADRGHERLVATLEAAPRRAIGAPTLAQAGAVIVSRVGLRGRALLSLFVEAGGVEVIDFDQDHWRAAASASVRYGRGHHPAALGLHDCMTYATARLAGAPLLAVGTHFPLTDLAIASD
jgi:ribonuclease VapC